jgi:ubiquinone/menaquinone biosynthesis C-methylase UbiE
VPDVVRSRRLLALAALGFGAWALGAVARPVLADVRRSLRTSSSPGAGVYDTLAGLFLGGYYDEIAADCAATLEAIEAPRVLEIGPGPGHLAERLLALIPDGRWTGLDIDPAMLGATRRRLADAGVDGRATLVEGDVMTLPFEDDAFDLVVSSLSAHHWPDAGAGFTEIRRVLRPGGSALVFDLPERWGHVESGSRGIGAAGAAFGVPDVRRFRGVGPWTLVSRVELREPGPPEP